MYVGERRKEVEERERVKTCVFGESHFPAMGGRKRGGGCRYTDERWAGFSKDARAKTKFMWE